MTQVKSEWKFLIKNPTTGKFVASLVNARDRHIIERLDNQGEAGFILDAEDDNCNTTILNCGVNELHIYCKDTLKWSGLISTIKKVADGNDTYLKVTAMDWVALLSKRFCGVATAREFTTIDAGTIAWTLISETQALSSFGITLGTIESSITRSPSYDKKNVLSAIVELSNMGQDGSASYGFDFEITPSKVFNVYYPYKGTVHNDVVFRYPGNCQNFETLVDSWNIVNYEYGLGRDWTGLTSLVERSDATSITTYFRREAIKNYRDVGILAYLQDMVYQDIQWFKNPSTVSRFTAQVDAKSGIDSYNVGDGVVVICDAFDADEWLWVYERTLDIDDNDIIQVTLTVGD